ncbi:MAG: glycosyltransferase [Coleofasciculaceae cyanobacterium]
MLVEFQTESQSPAFYQQELEQLLPITQRYLLVIGIECYRDQKGVRYVDQLWYKDIIQHLNYLKNLTIACPCRYQEPPKNAIALDHDPKLANVQFIDLPASSSLIQGIKQLPATIFKLWQAIGQASIVHTQVAGWPIPLGWLVTPIVLLRKKLYIIVVESAPWRVQPGTNNKLPAKIRAYVSERLNRWCVNKTDLAIFTQEEYKQSLLTKNQNQGHIIHASWIDEENVISEAHAKATWQQKNSASTEELKILFPGRLVANKGVLVLLEAMKILDKRNIPIKLDILGEGELFAECQKVSQSLQNTQIRMLGTLPYNSEFFNLLQNYHALIVPTISGEQPRIAYDAYSQAVPILGSDTAGMRDCVQQNKTGILVKSNDPIALAELLIKSWQNLDKLESMGMSSLAVARGMVHRTMHKKRWLLLSEMLSSPSALKRL